MATLRGAWRTLRAARASTLDVREHVREHAEHLAPGRWLPIPPQNNVWHHVDADLPPALFGVSGKARASTRRDSLSWNTRWQWAKRTALRTALRLARARRRVTVPSVGEGQGNATVVVQVQGGRAGFVALSPGERAVRVGGAGSFDAAYVDVRRRFERHVPAPSFTVNEDGAVLVEQWCDGPLLSQLPVAQRLPHALKVLEGYANLTAAEAVIDHSSMWLDLPAFLEQVTLPPWLAEPLADDRVRHLLNVPLLIPSQGDCWAANIVIGDEDLTARVIDFDWAGWHPVWFDLAKLSTVLGGEESHFTYSFGEYVSRILDGCGFEDTGGLDDVHWAALYGVGWACRQTQSGLTNDEASQVDLQRFVEIAEKRASEWRRLATDVGPAEPPAADRTTVSESRLSI